VSVEVRGDRSSGFGEADISLVNVEL
jgi:hypothetical protein